MSRTLPVTQTRLLSTSASGTPSDTLNVLTNGLMVLRAYPTSRHKDDERPDRKESDQ
jgi:hypothetical protein